jgi:hypothetical protein
MAFKDDLHTKIKHFHWIISIAGLIRIASLGMFIEVTGRFLSPDFNWLHIILIFIPVSWLFFHYLVITDKRSEAQMLDRIQKKLPELENQVDALKMESPDAVNLWNQKKGAFKLPIKPIIDSLWFFLACLVLASMFYILPKLG